MFNIEKNDYMRDNVLDNIKETIGFAKLDNTKTLIDTDVKLPDYIILKDALHDK